ncbi:3-dehydroquinate synthase [Lapidilactobacillus achengensis]|uniref:3-dehydroquinate synthase n=1 Tax=Lapidilactobacillus achengensis TaxID=2486000 RepID=A0ABW1UM34_9LACO|nr:3-dehydroquinate synthase [Lapidilactobacillus achengensis]
MTKPNDGASQLQPVAKSSAAPATVGATELSQWTLALADKTTQITLGPGARQQLRPFLQTTAARKILLLSDDNVAPLYLRSLVTELTAAGLTVITQVIAAGEASKNLTTASTLYQVLRRNEFSRQDVLIALGGGVIGDLGAFVASTYMRGMGLIQLPTTVVAQGDSSLGGKTAVDFAETKNLIGSFYPAQAVFSDPVFLTSLPPREISSGLAEMIKCLLIGAQPDQAQTHLTSLNAGLGAGIKQGDPALLALIAPLVRQGAQVKTDLVTRDFYDFRERRYLNFGHTVGHAVEALAAGQLRHGEAVSIGMVSILTAAVAHGLLAPAVLTTVSATLTALQLPTAIPAAMTPAQLLAKIALDKKVAAGQVELVLLRDWGQPYLHRVPLAALGDWLGWSKC